MNDFELNNKLEMIFDQLLDIKFRLGEIETEKKCKEIEETIRINQDRLECLHSNQNSSWQYRERLEKEFRNNFEREYKEYNEFYKGEQTIEEKGGK